ncbi:MAG: phosphotransacetylase family protein [Chloroflexi bacterium]|nr:phosphotransacetylase family protein [Chloroflexota bacterium]
MRVVYIAGAEKGAGKTSLASALVVNVTRRGVRAAAWKPLALSAKPHGEGSGPDADTLLYARLTAGKSLYPELFTPGDDQLNGTLPKDIVAKVLAHLDDASSDHQVIVAEGLDGLSVQQGTGRASRELASLLDARVLAVVPYRHPPEENYVSLARDLFGPALVGLVINKVPYYRMSLLQQETVPRLQKEGLPILGAIPEDRTMLSPTLGDVAQAVQGTFVLCPEKGNELVEYLMVGGFFMDEGLYVFQRRERKAVVVRGDRPDLQIAAIETDTVGLVLTGGVQPIQYILYEAEQRGVPLVVTQMDTKSAISACETLLNRAVVHHLGKVHRFAQLMDAHLDMEALLSSLGLPSVA